MNDDERTLESLVGQKITYVETECANDNIVAVTLFFPDYIGVAKVKVRIAQDHRGDSCLRIEVPT